MKMWIMVIAICTWSYSQSDTIYNSTENVTEKKGVDRSGYRKIEGQVFHPLVFDTNGLGSLSITAEPQNVDVFLNGDYLGKGNQLLNKLKTGMYRVNLKLGAENKETLVLVQDRNLSSVEYSLGKKMWFVFEPSYSNFYLSGEKCHGPSLDLGFQYRNSYYGIDYSWNFLENSNVEMWGGAAFKYRYCFSFSDIFTISPGAMAGFWYAEVEHKDPYPYDYDDWNDEFFWLGTCIHVTFGYKWVSLRFDNTILIGTAVSNLMKMGITLKL